MTSPVPAGVDVQGFSPRAYCHITVSPGTLGEPTERTVLEEALDTGRRAYLALARYDVEDQAPTGAFVETYWSAVAQPIRGLDGQVVMYELSLRNLTPVIAEFRAMQARHGASTGEM